MNPVLIALASVLALTATAQAQPPAARPAQVKAPVVQPAVDGLMEAFKTYPIVAIASVHGVAQEQDLWIEIIRDPRFATEVGNVVVESAAAVHQETMDRYVNGEHVSYTELRKVWLEGLVACCVPGTMVDVGNPYLFAAVREVNAGLPPERRIKVWLGEPPSGWSDKADLEGSPRDDYPAQLIDRDILQKNKKALVIYGGGHFRSSPRVLGGLIRRKYPNALLAASTYTALATPACSQAFEQRHKDWPAPALVTSIRGSMLESELLDPKCRPASGVRFLNPPGTPPETVARQAAEYEADLDQLRLGAMLYLGPSASLTRSPLLPEAYLDLDYRAELTRRHIPLRALPVDPTMSRPLAPASEDARQAAFKANDKDGDGKLDKTAYRAVLKTLGFADQLETLFAQRDLDRDGFVSAEEYRAPIPQ